MKKTQIEMIREMALMEFLSNHDDAVIVSEDWNRAIIETHGMGNAEVFGHLLMVALTVGLWIPVMVVVSCVRKPHRTMIHVNGSGEVMKVKL